MPSSVINSDDGVISGTSGIKATGGDDGVLVFQSKGTETAQINTDKQIVAAAGTASLPVLTTTGDLNTGIFFPAADNIGFATGGTIRGRWTTAGLCFGSDTAAANALDDYEEGTFTPSFEGTTTNPTITAGNFLGRYTKIGRVVSVEIQWQFLTYTGGSGVIVLRNMPFTNTSLGTGHGTPGVMGPLNAAQYPNSGNDQIYNFRLSANSTSITFWFSNSSGDGNWTFANSSFGEFGGMSLVYQAQ
jgi:hypothetical protein